MKMQEKKQQLREEIAEIEAMIWEKQPALDTDTRKVVEQLNRRLVLSKQLLIALSFPNGN